MKTKSWCKSDFRLFQSGGKDWADEFIGIIKRMRDFVTTNTGITTVREIFTNGPIKIFDSTSIGKVKSVYVSRQAKILYLFSFFFIILNIISFFVWQGSCIKKIKALSVAAVASFQVRFLTVKCWNAYCLKRRTEQTLKSQCPQIKKKKKEWVEVSIFHKLKTRYRGFKNRYMTRIHWRLPRGISRWW